MQQYVSLSALDQTFLANFTEGPWRRVQSVEYWVGSVLIPKCSAKSEDKLTNKKQETPRPSAALLMMKSKLHGSMQRHRFKKNQNKNECLCSNKLCRGLDIPGVPPLIFMQFIKIPKRFYSNDITSSKI